ncbi:MAG: hypothetical protein WC867_08070 [Candidatus Pacearchaeota archaeon]|jgi:hypothetical protein
MNIYDVISSNQTQVYISKVFGAAPIESGDFIFWIIISLIIGFTALTIRYTFNPTDKKEYELWKNESWPTKIFICLMVGGLSFFTTISFLELLSTLDYFIYGSAEKFNLVFRNGFLGSILYSMIYSTGFIWVLGKKGNVHYGDLKKFALFSIYLSIILIFLGTSLIVLKKSFSLGISFIAFNLFLIMLIILFFYLIPKNMKNTPKLKKEKMSLKDILKKKKK